MSTLDTLRLASRIRALGDLDKVPSCQPIDSRLIGQIEAALLAGETHYTTRPGRLDLRRKIAGELLSCGGPPIVADDPADHVIVTTSEMESLFVLLLALGIRSGTVLASALRPPQKQLFAMMGVGLGSVHDPDNRLVVRQSVDLPETHQELLGYSASHDLPDVLGLGASLSTTLPVTDPNRSYLIGNLDALPGMESFRVGYLFGPAPGMAACRTWKQAFSICTAAPSQRAALLAWGGLSDV